MIAVIMLGMGASLTPRDFVLALKRPKGLAIGVVSQYGFMPFIGFLLITALPLPEAIAVGTLIMACMPGGTTSNIFTYFSKGNLALSVLMTVTSTIFGVLLIPIVLLIYAGALDLEIPRENIIATLVLLLVPVAIGMTLRKLNANVGAVTEFMGSARAVKLTANKWVNHFIRARATLYRAQGWRYTQPWFLRPDARSTGVRFEVLAFRASPRLHAACPPHAAGVWIGCEFGTGVRGAAHGCECGGRFQA